MYSNISESTGSWRCGALSWPKHFGGLNHFLKMQAVVPSSGRGTDLRTGDGSINLDL